jgi:hypothetical protein
MPLETATYIDDLVATNPAASDGLSQADDHMRLIKATLLATFPAISGAVAATHTELDAAATACAGGVQVLRSGTDGAWFSGDVDTGLSHPATNQSALRAGGIDQVKATASQAIIAGNFTVNGTTTLTGAVTFSGGGAFGSGTYIGAPTFSGAINFTGTPVFSGAALGTGTYTGAATFSGAVIYSGTPVFNSGAALTGTFSGSPTFSGALTFSGACTASNAAGFTARNTLKAFATINNDGSPTVESGSFNVASVTLNGTGDCTVTFTDAIGSANYSVNATPEASTSAYSISSYSKLTGSVSFRTHEITGGGASLANIPFSFDIKRNA